jgi:hypothetical protein
MKERRREAGSAAADAEQHATGISRRGGVMKVLIKVVVLVVTCSVIGCGIELVFDGVKNFDRVGALAGIVGAAIGSLGSTVYEIEERVRASGV